MVRKGAPDASAKRSSADQPPRRTQRERSSQAEKALLDAASVLFSLRGVDQTSLADIGDRAGYSRGLANHHFGSKAALVERLAQRFQRQFVENSVVVRDGVDAIEILTDVVEAYLDSTSRHSETSRAFFAMWGAAIPAEASLRPVFAADDAAFRAGVEDLLRTGQANGHVDPLVDPSAGALAVVGMLRGVVAQFLIDPQTIDMSAATAMCQLFVRKTFTAPRKPLRPRR